MNRNRWTAEVREGKTQLGYEEWKKQFTPPPPQRQPTDLIEFVGNGREVIHKSLEGEARLAVGDRSPHFTQKYILFNPTTLPPEEALEVLRKERLLRLERDIKVYQSEIDCLENLKLPPSFSQIGQRREPTLEGWEDAVSKWETDSGFEDWRDQILANTSKLVIANNPPGKWALGDKRAYIEDYLPEGSGPVVSSRNFYVTIVEVRYPPTTSDEEALRLAKEAALVPVRQGLKEAEQTKAFVQTVQLRP